ncbi:serine hydrolase domain-containing protein [Peristeroidobacter agariperforans]|uniref:serine hydrolase domain-containing protein n=1 Tax=Peristeroidobacter agariperforans TaxID=268404 RepID=UPI0013007B08|nr:serine hydrolase domain-containing protein [Peristeroidobacter agariperforans]
MRLARTLAVLLCSLGSLSAALGNDSNSQASTAASAAGAPLTRADVEPWLDGFLDYELQRGDIAGGVVVIVKDGEVLLQKGYGYDDVEQRRPVDPERTLFRAGSVGKLFTETAVMQLVEQGKVDLDAPIDQYLDFKIPEGFGKPVTMRNLITHTGGFEEAVRELMHTDPEKFPSLAAFVKRSPPARIFPPGEVPSYCNYCLALAGYVVERVSGETFDEYLEHHIFGPLGMQRSTFRQPLPAKLAADMSKGYHRASGPPLYFELVGPAPAGSISATGADMARFMIAHLSAEQGGAPTLLQPDTARLMHTSVFQATPPVNGMALGFFEAHRNGQRIIEHGGDTQVFHSQLVLFMDQGVGLFMSFNSTGKEGAVGGVRTALFEQFTDRYFPAPIPDEPTTSTAVEHSRLVAGRYQSSRRAENTFFRAVGVLGQFNVTANADGTLIIPPLTRLDGQPKVWREVAPFVWREVGGKERLAAKIEDGRVRFLGHDTSSGIQVFMPVPAGTSAGWIVPVVVIAAVSLLLTLIGWPLAAWIRRRYGVTLEMTKQQTLARRLVGATAIVNLAVVIGWMTMIQNGLGNLALFDGRTNVWFVVLHFLGFVGLIGAGVAIWNAWLSLQGDRRWFGKTWSVVLAASCVAITWIAFTLNLVKLSLYY